MSYDPTAPVQFGDARAGVVLSASERYRYLLWRAWDPAVLERDKVPPSPTLLKPWVTFCGLNPSTANHLKGDATVARWTRYAQAWGFGGFFAVNLFALRSTDPAALMREDAPIGTRTDAYIQQAIEWSASFVACWGVQRAVKHYGRDRVVYGLASSVRVVHALKVTKDGFPSHPLRLRGDLKPIPWTPPWIATGPTERENPSAGASDAVDTAAGLREQQDRSSQAG